MTGEEVEVKRETAVQEVLAAFRDLGAPEDIVSGIAAHIGEGIRAAYQRGYHDGLEKREESDG